MQFIVAKDAAPFRVVRGLCNAHFRYYRLVGAVADETSNHWHVVASGPVSVGPDTLWCLERKS